MKNLLLARLFAEFQDVLPEASISKKSAEKILNALYAMNLSVEQLSWAISKIRCLKHDQMMAGLVDTATDADIKAVVNSIFEQIMLQRENSSTPDMAYAHNTEITAWMFEEIKKTKKKLKEGDQVNIQIMRVGKWKHPTYGEVKITENTLDNVQRNFEENKRGIDLAVDDNHEDLHRALGWIRNVFKQGKDALFATIELTKRGADLLTEGAYKYFSPEIIFSKKDEETGENVKDLLVGGAFTNRPFFKAMQPLMASEAADRQPGARNGTADLNSPVLFTNFTSSMTRKLLTLLSDVAGQNKIKKSDIAHIKYAFSELNDTQKADVEEAVQDVYNRFEEEEKAKVDDVQPAKPADAEEENKEGEEGGDKGEEKKEDEGEGEGDDEEDKAGAEQTEEEKKAAADAAEAEKKAADDAAAAADEAGKAGDGVQANDKGEVTMKASDLEILKNAQKTLSKMIKDNKTSAIDQRITKMLFSEKTKTGTLLPKDKKRIVAFCAGLSDPQAVEFMAILEGQSANVSKLFTELGSGAAGQEKNMNMSEAEAFYVSQGFTEEEAKEAAKEFVKAKAAQKMAL